MVAEVARPRACPAGYDEGMLRSYLDGELPAAWREQVQAHVPGCAACTSRLSHLRLDGSLVQGRLNLLQPEAVSASASPAAPPFALPPRPALATVLARARQGQGWRARASAWWRDNAPVAPAGGWPRPAPIAAGLVAGAVLAFGVATTQPAVQSFAQGVLQQFRVQRVQPVTIDLASLQAAQAARLPVSDATMDAFLRAGSYSGPREPKVRPVPDAAEAGKATGLTVKGLSKLPAQVKGGPSFFVSGPISFSYTFDSQKLAQVAQEAGVTDPALLSQLQALNQPGLNGVTIKGDVPAAVAVVYGNPFPQGTPASGTAGTSREAARDAARAAARQAGAGQVPATSPAAAPSVALIQLKSPTVQIPSGVDVLALRKQAIEAGVRAGVIPQSLAAQLLAITDLNTLPVPVVQGQSSQVTVDGAQGTLISSKEGHAALIWFKDGVLYAALSSGVSAAELQQAVGAGSLTTLR
ncbi:MAG TPA: zf-HC2 domain-containing protein [Chloroflexota bacterium]|nr:zf-HC2 domain-containing protein [Chloroflexota bacterium]